MTTIMRSIGLARPEHALDQRRAAEIASALAGASPRESRRVQAVFRRSGVESRGGVTMVEVDGQIQHRWLMDDGEGIAHTTLTGARLDEFMEYAPNLACVASNKAVEQSGIDRSQFTHIVTASCTGMASPGIDHIIIDRLGLPRDTQRTHIGFMGCHAALNAVRVGRAFALADPKAVVLVCCVELCSLHFQEGDSRDAMLANALFGDGAAATVITSDSIDGSPGLEMLDSPSYFLPECGDVMTWTVTDHGFAMTLDASVPDILESSVGEWVNGWCAKHGLSVPEINGWAIHPGGPQIIDAVRDALGIDESMCGISRSVLAECGNMSSPTILFVLDRMVKAGIPKPWGALAFGPGLSAEGLLIQ